MFSRIAALTGALLIASGSVFATGVEASTYSCEITAIEEGEILMTADGQWLVSEGVKPAVLGYKTVGGDALIKSFSSSVHYNGSSSNQVAKSNFQHAEVLLSYDGSSYQQVWQNKQIVFLTNQPGKSVDGEGRMNVHVRTNGHKNQNGRILMGDYVVKSTVACIAN